MSLEKSMSKLAAAGRVFSLPLALCFAVHLLLLVGAGASSEMLLALPARTAGIMGDAG